MTFRSNLHSHSVFSDGANTLEEMVLAAVGKGFVSLGISEHAWASYDSDCCIGQELIPVYLREMAALKKRYAGQIELYTGFESDYYHPAAKDGLDFTIGSVHYLRDEKSGAYYTVDHLPELFELARDRVAGGDIRRMVALYYSLVTDMAVRYRPDILGHIDLVTKLNRDGCYFDEDSGWYRQLTAETAAKIAASGCIVEVNTGGIYRGFRTRPYPSAPFLVQLRKQGAAVTISSDAHCADALDFWFLEAARLLKETGFTTVKRMQKGSFVDVPL